MEPVVPQQVTDLLYQLGAMAALLIPITGGVKGLGRLLLDELPDIHAGPWTIKDGTYVSWLGGLILLLLAQSQGWLAVPTGWEVNPIIWFSSEWALLAVLANAFRNWALPEAT